MLLYQADPAQSQEFPAARTLLELRWRAAREFGLVDGQSWKVLLSRSLAERAEFRAEVVLRAGARLDRTGVRDLLLGALLHGSGPGRLRAAARGMPRELARLVDNGLWRPADRDEWLVIFDELEADHLEAYAPELFESALTHPELRARALALYSRGGAQDLTKDIGRARGCGTCRSRAVAAARWGEQDTGYLARLAVLAPSEDPGVRAPRRGRRAAAQFALGRRRFAATLGDTHDAAPALLLELAANAHSGRRCSSCSGRVQEAEGETAARSGTTLAPRKRAWGARLVPRTPPRASRRRRPATRASWSTAAGRCPRRTRACCAFFRAKDTPGNLALQHGARTRAVRTGATPGRTVATRRAVWNSSFSLGARRRADRGPPACTRCATGDQPPPARVRPTTPAGYALGLWGGLPEVEALSQQLRYNSGAPALQGALLGFLATRTQ
ncbi:MAG: hypothetical protein IPJ19_19015 [Planctomycetes bacterium]|nr:hypothetical protein [Planctomycetota bacterium]